jgi:hypothetical protein
MQRRHQSGGATFIEHAAGRSPILAARPGRTRAKGAEERGRTQGVVEELEPPKLDGRSALPTDPRSVGGRCSVNKSKPARPDSAHQSICLEPWRLFRLTAE